MRKLTHALTIAPLLAMTMCGVRAAQAVEEDAAISEAVRADVPAILRPGSSTRHAITYSCFARYGRDQLIAAYSNGDDGVVRAYAVTRSGALNLLAESAPRGMGGGDCEVNLLDIDGDGRPEVIVSFGSVRGNSMDWVFQWTGNALVNSGPTVMMAGGIGATDLTNTTFIDILGDGTKQAISIGESPPPPDGSPPLPDKLFRYVNGAFVEEPFPVVEGGTAYPPSMTTYVVIPKEVTGPFALFIRSGGREKRWQEIEVLLNGKRIIPQAKKGDSDSLKRFVFDMANNSALEFRTTGTSGGGADYLLIQQKDSAALEGLMQEKQLPQRTRPEDDEPHGERQ